MASSFAALPLLVIAPAAERGFDVVLLPSLGAAAEQNDQHFAVPAEVNTIAGAAIDLEFGSAFTDRFDVRGVTLGEPLDRDRHAGRRLHIETVEPSPEGTAAFGDVFFNPDHLVSYMLLLRKSYRARAAGKTLIKQIQISWTAWIVLPLATTNKEPGTAEMERVAAVQGGSGSKRPRAKRNRMRQVAFLEVQAHLLRQVDPFTTTYERMRPCHG